MVSSALMDDFLFADSLGIRVEVIVTVAIRLSHADVFVDAIAISPWWRQPSSAREWDRHVRRRAVVFAARRRAIPLLLLVKPRGQAVERIQTRLAPEHCRSSSWRGGTADSLLFDNELAVKLDCRGRAGPSLR